MTPQSAHRSALSVALTHIPTVVSALIFAFAALHAPAVADGGVIRVSYPWAPSLGVEFSLLLDGLSLVFTLLIAGIGAFIFLYCNSYLAKNPQFGRFILFLFAFELSMLGLVLADNLITLFVFWELTTVTSYLLIGFDHASAKSRRSALQALLVTGMGGLALLAGFILMGRAAGSFEISEILAQPDLLRDHAHYVPIVILVLLGAFTKSAQVPFHFWLPNAMAAPTPVSAYLHSATMVKGGVYLMARLHPGLASTDIWLWSLTIAGAATAVWASVLAFRQTDLKQTLAYTTLMALGTLTLFLAMDTPYALTAVATFLIVHSLYKAALFLAVGIIDQQTGTREVDRLRGLSRAMPITAAAAALSALSMAGVPLLFGFIAKELQYAAAVEAATSPTFVTAAALTANALMVAVALLLGWKVFFSAAEPTEPTPLKKRPGEAKPAMWLGPIVMAVLGLIFGVAPGLAGDLLVGPAADAIAGREAAVELKIWHGVNLPLMLSLATFALGGLFYVAYAPLRRALAAAGAVVPSMDRAWDGFLNALKAFADWQTRVLQPGILRRYLLTVFAVAVFGLAATWVAVGLDVPSLGDIVSDVVSAPLVQLAVSALILAGTVVVLVSRSRISSVAGLGVVGIGVALIFILFSAPDVAITQLLVETLVVVLVAVAMLRLPFLKAPPSPVARPISAIVSVGAGVVTALLVMASTDGALDRRLTDFFDAASWPEAFGRNIVNVILVDFRALDTFGEIAVVAVAALSAFALLKGPKVLARKPALGVAPSPSAREKDPQPGARATVDEPRA